MLVVVWRMDCKGSTTETGNTKGISGFPGRDNLETGFKGFTAYMQHKPGPLVVSQSNVLRKLHFRWGKGCVFHQL